MEIKLNLNPNPLVKDLGRIQNILQLAETVQRKSTEARENN
jgi:hypothetical protein